MQDIVEHLQIDQNNLKNQFDLLIAEKNFAKQTKSPINNINLSNLEIVSPKSTTNLHTKINSDKSFSGILKKMLFFFINKLNLR